MSFTEHRAEGAGGESEEGAGGETTASGGSSVSPLEHTCAVGNCDWGTFSVGQWGTFSVNSEELVVWDFLIDRWGTFFTDIDQWGTFGEERIL